MESVGKADPVNALENSGDPINDVPSRTSLNCQDLLWIAWKP